MALGKPLIIVTQDLGSLPFDVKDMQALGYDRTQLHTSLGVPLRDIVRDTMSLASCADDSGPSAIQEDQARLVTGLGVQLVELKDMVGQIVQAWSNGPSCSKEPDRLLPEVFRRIEGAWRNESSDSYVYISSVADRLVAPYCYGSKDELTAYYYDWRKLGDYFFARFKWLSREITGFTFLRQTSRDVLQGAWWYDDDIPELPTQPLVGSGTPAIWRRVRKSKPPTWASKFVKRVQQGKVAEFR
jgi:hypothetical protein